MLVVTTPLVDVAKRAGNPKEGALASKDAGGRTRDERTLKRREAHERMNPFAQVSGGRHPVKTAGPVGNAEDEAGVGNPMTPLAGG
jgi:hypothetical protein